MRYLLPFLLASPAFADPPVVEKVRVIGDSIHVTLSHPDSGWDHYANLWQVFDQDGNLLATRELVHPHVTEQPFTRSTSLMVPPEVEALHIVASCSNDNTSEVFVVSLSDS